MSYLDTETYWIDKDEIKKLEGLIGELAVKYKIPFGEELLNFVDIFYMRFMETPQKKEYQGKFQMADTILKFTKLKGNSTIKTPTGSLDISAELLKELQMLMLDKVVEILNSLQLYGYPEEEKPKIIEERAKQERYEEKKPFKDNLNAILRWLKGKKIFSNNTKTIRNKEGAFLYDLFYIMKNSYNYNLSIDWNDPPEVLDNSDKRKIIESLIDK